MKCLNVIILVALAVVSEGKYLKLKDKVCENHGEPIDAKILVGDWRIHSIIKQSDLLYNTNCKNITFSIPTMQDLEEKRREIPYRNIDEDLKELFAKYTIFCSVPDFKAIRSKTFILFGNSTVKYSKAYYGDDVHHYSMKMMNDDLLMNICNEMTSFSIIMAKKEKSPGLKKLVNEANDEITLYNTGKYEEASNLKQVPKYEYDSITSENDGYKMIYNITSQT